MAKGPKGELRPADVIGSAIMVAKIATGEIIEDLRKPSGKVRSGLAGAKAREKYDERGAQRGRQKGSRR